MSLKKHLRIALPACIQSPICRSVRITINITILFAALAGLLCQCRSVSVDPVHIPDSNFRLFLTQTGADLDGDGVISLEEAEKINSMLIPPMSIESLEGIEAFSNLDTLSISINPIRSLDLRYNHKLSYLLCQHGELSELLLSPDAPLSFLDLWFNRLETLDVSSFPGLASLSCKNNFLEELDLRSNTHLIKMACCGNKLETLDLSKNTELKIIGIDNMPMLTEVRVWILPFPPEGIKIAMGYSPEIVFVLAD